MTTEVRVAVPIIVENALLTEILLTVHVFELVFAQAPEPLSL